MQRRRESSVHGFCLTYINSYDPQAHSNVEKEEEKILEVKIFPSFPISTFEGDWKKKINKRDLTVNIMQQNYTEPYSHELNQYFSLLIKNSLDVLLEDGETRHFSMLKRELKSKMWRRQVTFSKKT